MHNRPLRTSAERMADVELELQRRMGKIKQVITTEQPRHPMKDPTKPRQKPVTPTATDNSIFLMSKGRPHKYAVELRQDTAPILLALMQHHIGNACDIVHCGLTAVWYSLQHSPIPKAGPSRPATKAGQILTVQEILKGLLDDSPSEIPSQEAAE